MRIDKDLYGNESAKVCGRTIVQDASCGQGHCWETIHMDDLPASVREEIEGEMLDGGADECDDFVASNGQHYAW